VWGEGERGLAGGAGDLDSGWESEVESESESEAVAVERVHDLLLFALTFPVPLYLDFERCCFARLLLRLLPFRLFLELDLDLGPESPSEL